MKMSLTLTPRTLFAFQLVAHVATIYWLLQGPSLADLGVVFFIYFLTGCLGMSVCYHRWLTHRSFSAPRIFEYLFTLFATLGLTGSSLSWTAAHRQHHARADKFGDPHSPWIMGFIEAQWGSMFSPIDIKRSPVFRSRFHRFMHRNYLSINIVYGAGLLFFGGWNAMAIGWLVPACVLWNAGSLINTVCHTPWLGYKVDHPRSNLDLSVNNFVLGILMFGEGWHNNHHLYQRSPNIGRRWYEIDIGYYVIKLIRKQEWTKNSPQKSTSSNIQPLKNYDSHS